MVLKKSQRSNLLLLGVIAIVFFTPLRGIIQEYIGKARMFISSPSVENTEDRIVISDYQWALKGLNTTNYNFENAKGKVVFINFWATWCPPCRAEMPSIQKLYDDYKDKIVFVFQTNENPKKVIAYMDKNKYTLPSYNEISKTPKEFNVSSIPATYILNKKGEIVVHKIGAVDWNSDTTRKIIDALLLE